MSTRDRDTEAMAPSPAGLDQLTLPHMAEPEWRLDRRTCEIGRHGVAAARQILQRAGAGDDQRGRPARAA